MTPINQSNSMKLCIFSGSFDSLKTIPQQDGIDVYDNLKDFEHKMYSAQFMTLAVQSKGMVLYYRSFR